MAERMREKVRRHLSHQSSVASCISGFMMKRTALAIIRRAVSPMPIGRTPGCLSSAMRRQASSGAMDAGCTCVVQTSSACVAFQA